eukprot:jgi/Tetstr1/422213/TSEL_013065.t1
MHGSTSDSDSDKESDGGTIQPLQKAGRPVGAGAGKKKIPLLHVEDNTGAADADDAGPGWEATQDLLESSPQESVCNDDGKEHRKPLANHIISKLFRSYPKDGDKRRLVMHEADPWLPEEGNESQRIAFIQQAHFVRDLITMPRIYLYTVTVRCNKEKKVIDFIRSKGKVIGYNVI